MGMDGVRLDESRRRQVRQAIEMLAGRTAMSAVRNASRSAEQLHAGEAVGWLARVVLMIERVMADLAPLSLVRECIRQSGAGRPPLCVGPVHAHADRAERRHAT